MKVQIPKGMGNFCGLSGRLKSIVIVSHCCCVQQKINNGIIVTAAADSIALNWTVLR